MVTRAGRGTNRWAAARRGLARTGGCVLLLDHPGARALGGAAEPFPVTIGRLGTAALAIWLLARLNGQPLFPRRADLPLFLAFGLITALTSCAISPR